MEEKDLLTIKVNSFEFDKIIIALAAEVKKDKAAYVVMKKLYSQIV